ncbi:hypothetical protein HQ590_00960 [bacterium]|nr:hypothetical protein [bacterium]
MITTKLSLTGAGLLLAVAVSMLAGPREGWAIIQEINLNDQVAGTLNADQDVFPFYAAAGTKIRIRVQPGSFLEIAASLYGPDGEAVAGVTTKGGGANATKISGLLPTTGNYSIVVTALNGTWGTYSLKARGAAPKRIKDTANYAVGGQETITFDCGVAGSLLSSIKIKAGASTLSLDAAGVLTDPDGAVVALGSQSASGKKLTASSAFLAQVGTYSFKFTPTGTGPYAYIIKIKSPKAAGTTRTLSTARAAVVPPAATGVSIQISAPPNGAMFVSGDKPWITVVLKDDAGNPLALSQLSQARLHLVGPQETLQTTTALSLLRASGGRSGTHHYINLRTHPDAIRTGNMVHYPLSAVNGELPGTYTAGLWAVLAADSLQQWLPVADCQIKTAVAETQIVEKDKCAKCHFGPLSGKFYLHHADGSANNPNGNQGIDQWPVRTCKQCHNQEGYAANTDPQTGDRVVDPIVKRVHGIHNGHELSSPENAGNWLTLTNVVGTFAVDDTVTGGTSGADAKIGLVITNGSYVIVVGEIEGEFTTGETLSNGGGATGNLSVEREAVFGDYLHVEFPADVRNCTACHVDDRWKTQPSRLACGACHDHEWFGDPLATPAGYDNHPGGPEPTDANCLVCHGPGKPEDIAVKHAVTLSEAAHTVEMTLTPPSNGSFYRGVDDIDVSLVFRDAGTGAVVDPNTITQAGWNRVRFFAYGPRDMAKPVLTTAAEVNSPTASYNYNDLRVQSTPPDEDPRITRTSTNIVYRLDSVAGLTPGTYGLFCIARQTSGASALNQVNFQVGTSTEIPKTATNCMDCHGNQRMHGSYPFDTDKCLACHDYNRQAEKREVDDPADGWGGNAAEDRSNYGFGAAPIARRVHGVHFGHYVHKPEEIHGEDDYSEVIFPQDIRNCTKCHAVSSSWAAKPSRLACLACHDSAGTVVHGTLMTADPTPEDPWNGDEAESCAVCHGPGADFAVDKVHSIANPYRPPYLREPEE